MIIGIDFDNTIVSYDALFHRVAHEQGLIPPDLPVSKTAVRDHLRAAGREAAWTEMQGTVYGARIAGADPFPGVFDFFLACRRRGVPVRIISHKTRHPYQGESHDLHAAARAWLHARGFVDHAGTGLGDEHVFFELTKAAKLGRIAACGCTHFIDDLPELLAEPGFPANVERILFDPQFHHTTFRHGRRATDWVALQEALLGPEPGLRAWETAAARCSPSLVAAPLEQLPGGANNRVFRLVRADGGAALVKRYFQHPDDPRDRFATERAFYRYAAALGLPQVPQAIDWDETERLGVFTFVEGRTPAGIEPAHIEAALEFFADLNRQRQRREALALPAASEACFSLDAHLRSVQRRIDQVAALPSEDALDAEATDFVRQDLLPAWDAVSAAVRTLYYIPERTRVLPRSERCVSPSDFGFHNSLVRDDGQMFFIDFEYAGWDDPAKLVCDFFCQPDVPAPRKYFDRFVIAVAAHLGLRNPAAFAARCHTLLPVHQIKWSCILLNEFTGPGRQRREFSLGVAPAGERRARQLARARLALNGLRRSPVLV